MPFSVKKGRAHLERVRGSGFVGTEPPASAWGRARQILEGEGQQGPPSASTCGGVRAGLCMTAEMYGGEGGVSHICCSITRPVQKKPPPLPLLPPSPGQRAQCLPSLTLPFVKKKKSKINVNLHFHSFWGASGGCPSLACSGFRGCQPVRRTWITAACYR